MTTPEPIRIVIGFDPRETVAYHVLCHSLLEHASRPLAITPLAAGHLDGLLARPRDPLQSTDFAFSRFLTPALCGFRGWSIFMDCDMLALDDVAKLWSLREARFAVQVVKHEHRPRERVKFLGQTQTRYAKKNWSSVMLFNNARCTALTPDYVNRASGLDLHQFKWLESEDLIGELPQRWNVLVGYDDVPREAASILHYTTGGPYFDGYRDVPFAEDWFATRDRMLAVLQRARKVAR